VVRFATWITRFLEFVILLSSKVLLFTLLNKIQFHRCRLTIVWVTVLLIETKFFQVIFGRRFKEGFCFFVELIVSLFHSSFIQLIVEIDNYFDEIEHIANEFVIAHDFVLEIVFKISSKHCYKCSIVSFDKINILLKSCRVLDCKDSLS